MKRRILLCLFTMLLGATTCFADDSSVLWGIKATVDAEIPSKWRHDGSSVSMFRPGYGFTIGGVSNIYLGRNFYFEPGVSLAYSQYRYKDLVISDAAGSTLDTDPKIYKWALQVPLVVGYTMPYSNQVSMSVYTGPQLRYAFAGDVTFRHIDESDKEVLNLWNGQRRVDLSWKIGIGFPISDFMISVEADLGITDLLKNDFSFRENRVGFGLTYYF